MNPKMAFCCILDALVQKFEGQVPQLIAIDFQYASLKHTLFYGKETVVHYIITCHSFKMHYLSNALKNLEVVV